MKKDAKVLRYRRERRKGTNQARLLRVHLVSERNTPIS